MPAGEVGERVGTAATAVAEESGTNGFNGLEAGSRSPDGLGCGAGILKGVPLGQGSAWDPRTHPPGFPRLVFPKGGDSDKARSQAIFVLRSRLLRARLWF